jgi:hypothetical protein
MCVELQNNKEILIKFVRAYDQKESSNKDPMHFHLFFSFKNIFYIVF